MRSGFKQGQAYLSIKTPLGPDVLRLSALHGEEGLSSLFRFELELEAEEPALDFTKVVGQGATVTLALADGAKRHVHGVVTRFTQTGGNLDFASYRAELRPWLWWLGLATDSRIFQDKSTPEILTGLFKELGFTDHRNALTATYAPRPYCVQYQETTLAFVQRLMEEEGIFYFFEHDDGKHTLVLADAASAHAALPHLPAARYHPGGGERAELDVVWRCAIEERAVPTDYQSDDFNFETPAAELLAKLAQSTGARQAKVYDYPGGHLDAGAGQARARLRLQALQHPRRRLWGDSHCRAFTPGYKFALREHFRADVNGQYVLRHVAHEATRENYSNRFEAYPLSLPYRPALATPRPRIQGTQTAIVVGKAGEEIWTDEHGRIKVQFHWDQLGKRDENSSCWIRVAQSWAGQKWGSLFLPRVGQEVVVSFLEGDPERPLVTGCVYNGDQGAPYALPAGQTRSTVKSQSSKGGGGFNEIRFEDKKDAEELFIQAQRDLNVLVLNDRSVTVRQGKDDLVVEKGNRSVAIQTGQDSLTVKGERSVKVEGAESHQNQADFSHQVQGNYSLKVQGNLSIEVSGNLTIKSAQAVDVQAGTSLTNKAGTSLTHDAGTTLTSKAGASQTVDGGGALTLKGGVVKIN